MLHRRNFLKLTAGLAAALVPALTRGADETRTLSDDELLAAARERIDQHRRDRLTLAVDRCPGPTDPRGQSHARAYPARFSFRL
jgi:hypothetical protein